MNAQTASGRRRLLILAALFLGPLAAAWLLYFGLDGWRPSGSAAHGELIAPVVPLPEVDAGLLTSAPAQPLFRGVWTLTLLGGDRCGEHCTHALVNVRQVRLAMGCSKEPRDWLHLEQTSNRANSWCRCKYQPSQSHPLRWCLDRWAPVSKRQDH